MSPEALKMNIYTIKTDIWSLGITAIEIAQGEPPLSNKKPMFAMEIIKKNPIPSMKTPFPWTKFPINQMPLKTGFDSK